MTTKTKIKQSKRQRTLEKLERLAQSTQHPPEATAARQKIQQLKIHTEHVQVAPVIEGRSEGEITIGHWFLEGDNTVVICNGEGEPLRHYEVPCRVVLLPDQDARQRARGLIKEMHGAADTHGGFFRRLRYPRGSPV